MYIQGGREISVLLSAFFPVFEVRQYPNLLTLFLLWVCATPANSKGRNIKKNSDKKILLSVKIAKAPIPGHCPLSAGWRPCLIMTFNPVRSPCKRLCKSRDSFLTSPDKNNFSLESFGRKRLGSSFPCWIVFSLFSVVSSSIDKPKWLHLVLFLLSCRTQSP